MRKVAFCLAFVLLLGIIPPVRADALVFSPGDAFKINSQAVYLYNMDMDTAIYQQEEQAPMQPAHTVAIMTALLALENTADLDETFTYPSYIFDMLEPGVTQADVRRGEEMTMRKALYCLMMQSDCYSALAIADRVGEGDIGRFVEMMNAKARELGAENTNFTNPHGLYDEEMHTTAYDMALITKHAVGLEGFLEFCDKTTTDIGPTNKHPDKYNLFTAIDMLMGSSAYYYEPVQGIKTGVLDEAGRSYISIATKNGYTYLLVLLGAPLNDATGERLPEKLTFIDAKNLYEWAFNGFETRQLVEKGKVVGSAPVRLSKEEEKVNVLAGEDVTMLMPVEMDMAVNLTFRFHDIDQPVDAPFNRGKQLGTMDVVAFNQLVATVPLLAEKDVNRSQMLYVLDYIKGLFKGFWVKFVVVLVVLVLAFYITLMVLRNRYRKRRRRAARNR